MVDEQREIIKYFGPESDQPEVLFTLQDLCKLHALSVEDLYIKWEQYSYQRHESHTELSPKNLEQFKHFLQSEVEKHAKRISENVSAGDSNHNTSSSINKPRNVRQLNAGPSLFGFNIPKTPVLKKKRKLESNPMEPYSDHYSSSPVRDVPNSSLHTVLDSSPATFVTPREEPSVESGKTLNSLNPEHMEVSQGLNLDDTSEEAAKLKIQGFYNPEKYKFRVMRQSLNECSDFLDEQIDIFTKLIRDHYNLSETDIGDPTIQSQNEIYTVGRIVPDSPQPSEFLNSDSLALETSRNTGIGRRVRLNLSQIEECSLFCGQLVGLKGKNANGDYFLVNQILEPPYPDAPVSTADELMTYRSLMKEESSKIVITAGPFIPEEGFDLTYLSEFIDKINNEIKPHVLIMFGPFIDVTNKMIMTGNIPTFPNLKQQPKTLDDLFIKLVTPILKRVHPLIQVILIPSTRDTASTHMSYPQDSFNRRTLQLPKNFKCFTNPCTFQINEAFFGCSNIDIFKDMKEVTKGGKTSMRSRFDRISEHILQQRRYYPVFPGSIRKVALLNGSGQKSGEPKMFKHISGADLEVAYLGLSEFAGNFAPDVVIIPSELAPFVNVVKNVVFINPGRFVKARGARGTHAQITIACPDPSDGKLTKVGDGNDSVYLQNIWRRSRVDIVTN